MFEVSIKPLNTTHLSIRRPGRLLNILSTLDLRPVSAGNYIKTIQLIWSANQAPSFCLFNMSVKLILNDLNKYGERVKFA